MLNAERFAEPLFAAYRNLPVGSTASALGEVPAANAEPNTEPRDPSAAIVNAEMFEEPLFATNRNLFAGSTVTAAGCVPTTEYPLCRSWPVEAFTVNCETVPSDLLATNANLG